MIEDIQKRFNEVISYSQCIPEPHTDKLFEKWSSAKKFIIEHFLNGKLIYTYPEKVSFELDDNFKTERKQSFIDYVINLLGYESGYKSFIIYLTNILTNDFYNNSLSKDMWISNEKTIKQGTRVVKSFKYFIKDEKLLNDIQSKASELIQENKIEGYLNFSVHPLDFLSNSENISNWRSCHALDGDYRAGNLSYMVDGSTIICYLSNGNDYILPNFPETVKWNSKKWRCLLFFNKHYDMMFAGRQYPFFSPGALEKVREIFIKGLIKEIPHPRFGHYRPHWSHWHNDYIKDFHYSSNDSEDYSRELINDGYFSANGYMYSIKDIVNDCENPLHFNDLLRSSVYEDPYYIFIKSFYNGKNKKFYIGGEVPCLLCEDNNIVDSESMVCEHCIVSEDYQGNYDEDRYLTCDCCGNRFRGENGYWVSDDRLCPHCYEVEAFNCDECGNNYYNDEKHWVEEEQKFMCDRCYERYLKSKDISTAASNITLGPDTLKALKAEVESEQYFPSNWEEVLTAILGDITNRHE